MRYFEDRKRLKHSIPEIRYINIFNNEIDWSAGT